MRNEKIVCSAIEITGLNEKYNHVYLGLRHTHCFQEIKRVWERESNPDEWRVKCLRNNVQGFLTTENRFVDRIEGMIIARNQNQVIHEVGNSSELYSENLY